MGRVTEQCTSENKNHLFLLGLGVTASDGNPKIAVAYTRLKFICLAAMWSPNVQAGMGAVATEASGESKFHFSQLPARPSLQRGPHRRRLSGQSRERAVKEPTTS